MLQQSTKLSAYTAIPSRSQKILLLNGYPAIAAYVITGQQQFDFCTEENTLLVVREGAITIKCGKVDHMVDKDQMVAFKHNTLVSCKCFCQPADETEKTEYLIFHFSQQLVKQFVALAVLNFANKNEVPGIVINRSGVNIQKFIDSLEPYLDISSNVDENLTKIKILELLFCLASADSPLLPLLLHVKRSFRPSIYAVVEEHLMSAMSLDELAALSQRSLSSFRRDFLSVYNMPPSQWIREQRLKKAKELLRTTGLSIADICYSLGFENSAHFSRLFKSKFGISPSDYRAR
ncbi:helix-turn-helix domain-containing protein [Longitalea luteola]|uniref:helix-turn-helix domain-containing protein n=1 Tax=Longitalea luteola TaxID=2812563 RepID=UPI001A96E2D4|nr:AraC family transcriptional regulator [Longitalea luteola]